MSRVFYPACHAFLQVVLDNFASDDGTEPLIIPILPKTATIHRNSYRQADSFELGFDTGDLPFDPRIIRTGFAEIYLFQTDGTNDLSRVLSRKDPLADIDLRSLNPRTPVDTLAVDAGVSPHDRFTARNKPIVAGLFDRSSLELSTDGKWVSINGQDMTAHLASIQWPPEPGGTARRIPVGKRLDQLVIDLVEEADPTGKLLVEVRGIKPGDLPIVGAGDVRGSARGIPVEQNTTYWDVIYKTVTRVGFIAFVDGVHVVISKPKTITDRDVTDIKVLTWGKNIEHLTMERELGKTQAPTIVVKAYDHVSRKTISVEYPPNQINHTRQKQVSEVKIRGTEKRAKTTERQRARTAAHGRGKVTTTLRKRDEYEIVEVYGVTDRADLERIAETRYHLIGKAERRCVVKTRDLTLSTKSDMLNLTAGDAVLIAWGDKTGDEFDKDLLASTNVPDDTKVQHLVERGYNRATAQAIARSYAQLEGLDRPLRVKEATYDFSVENGIDIELELFDFIVIDGVRDGDGERTPHTEAHWAKLVKHDGSRLGWSPAQRSAAIRKAQQ